MPLHDWTKVPSGLFHDFHQSWSVRIKDALNSGLLPPNLSALVEQRTGPGEADVLAIESHDTAPAWDARGTIATMPAPTTRFVQRSGKEFYARRANRIIVRHALGGTVAVVEIVSPGNKHSVHAIGELVQKSIQYLRAGVHVLLIDPFAPTSRDPAGIHQLIWDDVEDLPFTMPPGKDRMLVSYESDGEWTAYIEPIGPGDALPDMPLFVARERHVMVPLETTYQQTWSAMPLAMRNIVTSGAAPDPSSR